MNARALKESEDEETSDRPSGVVLRVEPNPVHELRNIVSTMMMNVRYLRAEHIASLDRDGREAIEDLDESANRLLALLAEEPFSSGLARGKSLR